MPGILICLLLAGLFLVEVVLNFAYGWNTYLQFNFFKAAGPLVLSALLPSFFVVLFAIICEFGLSLLTFQRNKGQKTNLEVTFYRIIQSAFFWCSALGFLRDSDRP